MKEKLQKIRESIDSVDNKIIELLEERMGYVKQVAELKADNPNISYIRADREVDMLKKLLDIESNLPPQIIIQIWRLIISMSLQEERSFSIIANCEEAKQEYLKRLVREYFSSLTNVEFVSDFTKPELIQDLIACQSADAKQYEFLLRNKGYKIFTRLPDLNNEREIFELSDVHVIAAISEEVISFDRAIIAVLEGKLDAGSDVRQVVKEIEVQGRKYGIYDVAKTDFFELKESQADSLIIEFLGGYVESFT